MGMSDTATDTAPRDLVTGMPTASETPVDSKPPVTSETPELILGGQNFGHRPVVMGILNRTPDSFYDAGAYWDFDDFLRLAETLVEEGADILDVGGVKAGPGTEVAEAEELDRVVPAIAELAKRFDVPVSADTWRASVAEEAYKVGAVLGNDISGFGDPDYLHIAAEYKVGVVACHVRLAPRYADPNPIYQDLVADVKSYLGERRDWAIATGIPRNSILLDLGLDLGKTPAMSAELLRASHELLELGCPLLLSASNKGFLGELCEADITQRDIPSMAAHALGLLAGCQVLRVHNVKATKTICETIQRLREAHRHSAPAQGLPAQG